MDVRRLELEKVTARQHSLITRPQLRTVGYSDDQIKRLVSHLVLERIRPSVFALRGVPPTWERGLLAAILSVGAAAVASHASAAKLWQFKHLPETFYEITMPRTRFFELMGVRLHRSLHFDEVDLVQRHGVPCTSYARTLCDCSTLLTPYQLGRVLDDGLRRRLLTLRELRDCAERLESGPGRHMSVIRSLLADRDATFEPGGSDPELRVLDVLRRAGLPVPMQQHRIKVGNKTYRPDYAWAEYMVFGEYYGLPEHTGSSAVIYDSERLTALAAAGWLPLIFTKASTDREIVERTAAALSSRRVGKDLGA